MDLTKFSKQQLMEVAHKQVQELEQKRIELDEVKADLVSIGILVKDFVAVAGIPEKVSYMWLINNAKAVFNLIKGIVTVIVTKQTAA